MIKYLGIAAGLIMAVILVVLYFQLYAGSSVAVPFFTKWIEIKKRTSMVMMIAFLCGAFITLGVIKAFSSGSHTDDDFDL